MEQRQQDLERKKAISERRLEARQEKPIPYSLQPKLSPAEQRKENQDRAKHRLLKNLRQDPKTIVDFHKKNPEYLMLLLQTSLNDAGPDGRIRFNERAEYLNYLDKAHELLPKEFLHKLLKECVLGNHPTAFHLVAAKIIQDATKEPQNPVHLRALQQIQKLVQDQRAATQGQFNKYYQDYVQYASSVLPLSDRLKFLKAQQEIPKLVHKLEGLDMMALALEKNSPEPAAVITKEPRVYYQRTLQNIQPCWSIAQKEAEAKAAPKGRNSSPAASVAPAAPGSSPPQQPSFASRASSAFASLASFFHTSTSPQGRSLRQPLMGGASRRGYASLQEEGMTTQQPVSSARAVSSDEARDSTTPQPAASGPKGS